jgi:hypothetical protein
MKICNLSVVYGVRWQAQRDTALASALRHPAPRTTPISPKQFSPFPQLPPVQYPDPVFRSIRPTPFVPTVGMKTTTFKEVCVDKQ